MTSNGNDSSGKVVGSSSAEIEARVNLLLKRGQAREALDLAKARLKRKPSPEIELLVARCYRARAEELFAAGGEAEARQILAYATERFPKHSRLLNGARPEKEEKPLKATPVSAVSPVSPVSSVSQKTFTPEAQSFAEGDLSADIERRVERLLRTGATREALDAAKTLLKKKPGETAERLAIECYQARAQELYARGQTADAQQLLAHAVARFPRQAHRIGFKHFAASPSVVPADELGALLRDLGQTSTTPEKRRELADAIGKILCDPRDILENDALPADDPLRREAEAVWQALEATTLRPTEDADVAGLNIVSRHSPLAAWKLLVRALRAYYQGRVESVATNMAVVPEHSPLRALAEPLRILTAPSPPSKALHEMTSMLQELSGGLWDLRRRMIEAEKALRAGRLDEGYGAVAFPLRLLRDRNPLLALELTVGLGRCVLENLDTSIEEFVDAQVKYLYSNATLAERAAAVQVAALALEKDEPRDALECWQLFLAVKASAPLQERLTPSEIRLIRSRMASLAMTISTEENDLIRNKAGDDEAALPAPFDPEEQKVALRAGIEQYQLALAAEPDSRIYEHLYRSWQLIDEKEAERAAEKWHAAFPREIKPLLILVAATEKRDALHKALAYLDEAERLNPLHAEVRAARLRLHYAQFRKHLLAGQRILAENDLKRVRFEAGDSTAIFVQILHFILAFVSAAPDDVSARQKLDECAAALRAVHRHPFFGPFLALNMAADCGAISEADLDGTDRVAKRFDFPRIGEAADLEVFCEAYEFLLTLGFSNFLILDEQRRDFENVVATHPAVSELLNVRICRLIQPHLWPTLVYIASGRGLTQGRAHAHLFLFKRGLAMEAAGPVDALRLLECYLAAATLAQLSRTTEIAAAAAKELWRLITADSPELGSGQCPLTPPPLLEEKKIVKVIKRESEPPSRNAQGEWILPGMKKKRAAGIFNFKRFLRPKP